MLAIGEVWVADAVDDGVGGREFVELSGEGVVCAVDVFRVCGDVSDGSNVFEFIPSGVRVVLVFFKKEVGTVFDEGVVAVAARELCLE